MKLASDWIQIEPAIPVGDSFHDEVEEYDEVDESKDGCGGVGWQKYVLRAHHTRLCFNPWGGYLVWLPVLDSAD